MNTDSACRNKIAFLSIALLLVSAPKGVIAAPFCAWVEGNLNLSATSSLRIEIGGASSACTEELPHDTDHDRLVIEGELDLGGGVLELEFVNGFVGSPGDTIDVLDWSNLVGTFGAVDLSRATLPPGAIWDLSFLYVTGEVRVVPDLDTDGDGYFDSFDADIDGDGIPNNVEASVGLDAFNNADGSTDLDLDSWSNVDEFRLGTAIDNAADNPAGFGTLHQKVFGGSAAADDQVGRAIALDGDTAVVGASRDSDYASQAGSAYVFVIDNTLWDEQAQLLAPSGVAGDFFGNSVAISGDRIAIGAPFEGQLGANAGAVYIFERTGTQWAFVQKIVSPDAAPAGDNFGNALALDGDWLLIGASSDSNGGAVYAYQRNGSWQFQQKLQSIDMTLGQRFGSDISMSGDRVLIGANLDSSAGNNAGSAYVFLRTGSNWTQETKLLPGDLETGDFFGTAVSLSSDTAAVGAFRDDDNGADESGSVYVYTRSGTSWLEQAKLNPADASADAGFGTGVAVVDDALLVGAEEDGGGGIQSGAAYLFTRTQGTWTERAKFNAEDAEPGDRFGFKVAMDGTRALVGANLEDDTGAQSGIAYFYELDRDADGLFDPIEATLGTDPLQADSDGDGLDDADEVSGGADPFDLDAGVDTEPTLFDTDMDGFGDGTEVASGSDPLDPESQPASVGEPIQVPLPAWSFLFGVLMLGWVALRWINSAPAVNCFVRPGSTE